MNYLGVLAVVACCLSAAFALPPCTCTRNLKPVCGSDGQTYSNPCLLECAATNNPGLTLTRLGPCELVQVEDPICGCQADPHYVCGSDGKTYPNECILVCTKQKTGANIQLLHEGECNDEASCICTLEYSPVCGTDGRTYPNKCALQCKKARSNVDVAHPGQCAKEQVQVADPILPKPSSCTCGREKIEVCASNGQTYANECLMRCVSPQLTIVHGGPCY